MKRNLRPRTSAFVALAAFALSASCSTVEMSEGDDDGVPVGGSGGASGASGSTSVGGTNGGTTSAGGVTSGTGGNVAGTSGTPGAGGVPGTGGAPTTGGVPGTGGMPGTGGAAGLGGADGGSGLGGTGAGIGGAGGAPLGGTGGTGQGGAGAGGTAGKGGAGAGGTAGKGGAGASGAAGKGGSGGSGMTGTAPSSGCGKAPTVTSGRTTIDVNGKMREYIVLVPSNYDQNKPYRLIFGWHPWGGSAQQTQQMGYFGLSTPSAGQAVLVAPEGQDFQDGGLGWGNANGEDVAFAHAMMDRFFAGLCIDQNRVFSTGFSFGAMFSFTLACTANSGMRAIAPMAGNSTTSGRCENGTRSVATMAFVGTNDSLLAVHRTAVQIFVGRNGCTTTKTPVTPSWCDGLASQYLPCSCVQYQGCKDGYPVVECEYTAGHQFAPSSGQTLWNFFSQF